jgi:hypothetical protein
MNKMKEYAMITVAALAFMLITGVAKADGTDKITEIGQKVSTHISNEIAETKSYQAKSWADAKKQWQSLKTNSSRLGTLSSDGQMGWGLQLPPPDLILPNGVDGIQDVL